MPPPPEVSPAAPPPPLEPPRAESAPEPVLLPEQVYARERAEEREFERMVMRLGGKLHKFAYDWLKSRDEVDDLMQKVLVNAWDHDMIGQCGGDEARMWGYLRQAMNNEIIDLVRNRRRRNKLLARYSAFVATLRRRFNTADEDTIEADIGRHVDRLLGQLSPRCRAAFELVRRQHKSYAQAAEELRMSVDTLRAHMRKAHAHLRKGLAAVGYYHHPEARGGEMEDTL